MPVVGKLILKLGVEAENLDALKNFENQAKSTAGTSENAAKATNRHSAATTNLGRSAKRIFSDINKLKWAIIGVAAASTAASKFGGMFAQQMHQFTANTGMSADMLQRWQQQAAIVGVSSEEMQDSLVSLQRTMTEIRLGMGGDIKAFQMLGLSTSASAEQILNALSEKLPGMDPAQGSLWASKLGLSEGMISMLREAKSLRNTTDGGLIITEAELRRLRDFNMYFNRMWDNIKRMVMRIGVMLAPLAEWVTWAGMRFVKLGHDIVKVIMYIWKALGPFKIVFIGLFGAILFKIAPVIASLIALSLVLEDIAGFFRGDNSRLGLIIAWFSDLRRVVQDVALAMAAVIDALERIFMVTGLREIFNKLTGLQVTGLGESLAAGVNAAFGAGYNDVGMAAMKDGKLVNTQSGATINNSNTVNINGGDLVKVKKAVMDAMKASTNQARGQLPVPEGVTP